MATVMKKEPLSPARELVRMRNGLRRFFEEPFGLDFRVPMDSGARREPALWSPNVEVTEMATEYVVTAELPGISPENVEVSVADGLLTLKGSKDEERRSDDKDRTWHLWEREYGRFERALRFPLEVDDAKVLAEFTNGVLTIRVPKVPQTRPAARTVPIAKKL